MGAHAVILPLVIYAGLEVSGAHFNPMVTASFVATGKLVCFYFLQQTSLLLKAACEKTSLVLSMTNHCSSKGLQTDCLPSRNFKS